MEAPVEMQKTTISKVINDKMINVYESTSLLY